MNWFKKLFNRSRCSTIVADGGSSVCSAGRDVVVNYGHNNGIISAVNDGVISSSFGTTVSGSNHSVCIKTDVNGNEIAIIDGKKVELPEKHVHSVQMINGEVVINGCIYKDGEWVKK